MNHNGYQITQVDDCTVSDLLDFLQTLPPDLLITFPNQEGGFKSVKGLVCKELLLNVNDEFWYGKHDWPHSVPDSEQASYKKELCVILLS